MPRVGSFSSCKLSHQPPLLPGASARHLYQHHHHHQQQQQQPPAASSSGGRFSGEQIACLCDAMLQIGHVDRLVSFLWSLSPAELLAGRDPVVRARATVAFHQGKYRELYAILEGHSFDAANHASLQHLWYRAHYAEAEKIRGRPLGQWRLSYALHSSVREPVLDQTISGSGHVRKTGSLTLLSILSRLEITTVTTQTSAHNGHDMSSLRFFHTGCGSEQS